jgi:hypothetical protein
VDKRAQAIEEAFARALRKRRSFRGEGSREAWAGRSLCERRVSIVAAECTPDGRRLFVTVHGLRIGPTNVRDLAVLF